MVSANAYRAFVERQTQDLFMLECFDTTNQNYWLRWQKHDDKYHYAIIPRSELQALYNKYVMVKVGE